MLSESISKCMFHVYFNQFHIHLTLRKITLYQEKSLSCCTVNYTTIIGSFTLFNCREKNIIHQVENVYIQVNERLLFCQLKMPLTNYLNTEAYTSFAKFTLDHSSENFKLFNRIQPWISLQFQVVHEWTFKSWYIWNKTYLSLLFNKDCLTFRL